MKPYRGKAEEERRKWKRELELHQRSSAYETDEILLLHPAGDSWGGLLFWGGQAIQRRNNPLNSHNAGVFDPPLHDLEQPDVINLGFFANGRPPPLFGGDTGFHLVKQ